MSFFGKDKKDKGAVKGGGKSDGTSGPKAGEPPRLTDGTARSALVPAADASAASLVRPAARGLERYRERGAAAAAAERFVNVVILVDATYSMRGLIDMAKAMIEEIMRRTIEGANGVRVVIQLGAYRDYYKMSSLFERSPRTSDIKVLLDWLKQLKVESGGDDPEAVESPLEMILRDAEQPQVVILIGDAPPHSLEEIFKQRRGHEAMPPRIARVVAAEFGKRGIPIHALPVINHPPTVSEFGAIAQQSGGQTALLQGEGAAGLVNLMVMAILAAAQGTKGIKDYMKRYELSAGTTMFAKGLLAARSTAATDKLLGNGGNK